MGLTRNRFRKVINAEQAVDVLKRGGTQKADSQYDDAQPTSANDPSQKAQEQMWQQFGQHSFHSNNNPYAPTPSPFQANMHQVHQHQYSHPPAQQPQYAQQQQQYGAPSEQQNFYASIQHSSPPSYPPQQYSLPAQYYATPQQSSPPMGNYPNTSSQPGYGTQQSPGPSYQTSAQGSQLAQDFALQRSSTVEMDTGYPYNEPAPGFIPRSMTVPVPYGTWSSNVHDCNQHRRLDGSCAICPPPNLYVAG